MAKKFEELRAKMSPERLAYCEAEVERISAEIEAE